MSAPAIQAGDELPAITVTPSATQLFMFSAAVHNAHRIHYDEQWATGTEGHPGVVIQGALQSALLAQVVTTWMGARGRLVRFAARNRGAAYLGDTLQFTGTVTEVRRSGGGAGDAGGTGAADGSDVVEVDVELQAATADGRLLMPGTATVTLPAREGS